MVSGQHVSKVAILALVLLVAAGVVVHLSVPQENRPGTDISFDYEEAQRILRGENPYARILSGDMRTNQKYPTYFPLFYLLSAGVIRAGLSDYASWLQFWRVVNLFFNIAAGVVLFGLLYRRNALLLAILGACMWFLNRWGIRITESANIDYPAVFFLLLALWLVPKHRLTAFLMLSFSLGFKQLAAILVPLFLIYVWHDEREHPVRAVIVALAVLASTLIITSLPFFASSPEGFLKSMIFQLVRDPSSHISGPTIDSILKTSGIVSRLPFSFLLGLVYLMFWHKQIGLYAAGLLVMSVFINLSPVLFMQYFVWLMPFIPLAASETGLALRPTRPAGS